ncbi:HNH endonuclease, partial [Streptomyces sp. UNOC14_S4]|uniref:HNH endonuclease n=1 Tax=Streptomyces sp. UNOC14_S4 TaxID=2872340 RepID=UPI001E299667
MTTGRLGQHAAPPNTAYAGQVVHFPDPVRAARHPKGVRVDEDGFPDFSPYARAAAEIAEPPEGFGVDELRLTDYVSANAAQHAAGHELWASLPPVATPHGWTWHHVAGTRRLELVPAEV